MKAKTLYFLSLSGLIILVNSCGLRSPRIRMGTLPTPPPGPRFYEPDELGNHSYRLFSPFEKNGIVYTCKAGHIDITHLRWSADYTRYFIVKIRNALMRKDDVFTFSLSIERSQHKVLFAYPKCWDSLSRKTKEKIADSIAFDVAPYLVFQATIWHEILTWFGVHFIGVEPEFNSAFSWEDIYSNLLGTKLAVEAVKNTQYPYNRAMTLAIDRKLGELGAQPKSVAIYASEKVRDKWYTGYFLVDTIRKNMDIGLNDGFVTPVLVPGICYNAQPEPLAVPNIDLLEIYGFSMKHNIYPNEWERGKILKVIYPDGDGNCVVPEKHFSIYIEYIKKQAVEKYNYIVD